MGERLEMLVGMCDQGRSRIDRQTITDRVSGSLELVGLLGEKLGIQNRTRPDDQLRSGIDPRTWNGPHLPDAALVLDTMSGIWSAGSDSACDATGKLRHYDSLPLGAILSANHG